MCLLVLPADKLKDWLFWTGI